jgi:hypothetical protein
MDLRTKPSRTRAPMHSRNERHLLKWKLESSGRPHGVAVDGVSIAESPERYGEVRAKHDQRTVLDRRLLVTCERIRTDFRVHSPRATTRAPAEDAGGVSAQAQSNAFVASLLSMANFPRSS